MPEFMEATAEEAAALVFEMCRVELEGHGVVKGCSIRPQAADGPYDIVFRFTDRTEVRMDSKDKVMLR